MSNKAFRWRISENASLLSMGVSWTLTAIHYPTVQPAFGFLASFSTPAACNRQQRLVIGMVATSFDSASENLPGLPPVLPIVNAYLSVSSLAVPVGGRSERLVLSRYRIPRIIFVQPRKQIIGLFTAAFRDQFCRYRSCCVSEHSSFRRRRYADCTEKVSIPPSDFRTGAERKSTLTASATEGNQYYWPQLVDSEATIQVQKSKTSKVRSSQPITVVAPGSYNVRVVLDENDSGLLDVELSSE